MSPRRFAFYEEVRLARPSEANAAFAGCVGAVVGLGEAPGEPPIYGVLLHGRDELLSCDPREMEPTGRQFRREDFYDDTRRVRVGVDAQGRGWIV